MKIYLNQNGIQKGPFSMETLQDMVNQGQASTSEFVWHEGLTTWQPLQSLLTSPQPPPIPYSATPAIPAVGPTGVGGWLVFFCVTLTIISPLFTLLSIPFSWFQLYLLLPEFPILKIVLLWENLGSIALMIYGFIVGVRIWKGSPKGRRMARQFLIIQFLALIGIEAIVLLLMMGKVSQEMLIGGIVGTSGGVFRSLIYAVVWWLYFMFSKRVKNTYGNE